MKDRQDSLLICPVPDLTCGDADRIASDLRKFRSFLSINSSLKSVHLCPTFLTQLLVIAVDSKSSTELKVECFRLLPSVLKFSTSLQTTHPDNDSVEMTDLSEETPNDLTIHKRNNANPTKTTREEFVPTQQLAEAFVSNVSCEPQHSCMATTSAAIASLVRVLSLPGGSTASCLLAYLQENLTQSQAISLAMLCHHGESCSPDTEDPRALWTNALVLCNAILSTSPHASGAKHLISAFNMDELVKNFISITASGSTLSMPLMNLSFKTDGTVSVQTHLLDILTACVRYHSSSTRCCKPLDPSLLVHSASTSTALSSSIMNPRRRSSGHAELTEAGGRKKSAAACPDASSMPVRPPSPPPPAKRSAMTPDEVSISITSDHVTTTRSDDPNNDEDDDEEDAIHSRTGSMSTTSSVGHRDSIGGGSSTLPHVSSSEAMLVLSAPIERLQHPPDSSAGNLSADTTPPHVSSSSEHDDDDEDVEGGEEGLASYPSVVLPSMRSGSTNQRNMRFVAALGPTVSTSLPIPHFDLPSRQIESSLDDLPSSNFPASLPRSLCVDAPPLLLNLVTSPHGHLELSLASASLLVEISHVKHILTDSYRSRISQYRLVGADTSSARQPSVIETRVIDLACSTLVRACCASTGGLFGFPCGVYTVDTLTACAILVRLLSRRPWLAQTVAWCRGLLQTLPHEIAAVTLSHLMGINESRRLPEPFTLTALPLTNDRVVFLRSSMALLETLANCDEVCSQTLALFVPCASSTLNGGASHDSASPAASRSFIAMWDSLIIMCFRTERASKPADHQALRLIQISFLRLLTVVSRGSFQMGKLFSFLRSPRAQLCEKPNSGPTLSTLEVFFCSGLVSMLERGFTFTKAKDGACCDFEYAAQLCLVRLATALLANLILECSPVRACFDHSTLIDIFGGKLLKHWDGQVQLNAAWALMNLSYNCHDILLKRAILRHVTSDRVFAIFTQGSSITLLRILGILRNILHVGLSWKDIVKARDKDQADSRTNGNNPGEHRRSNRNTTSGGSNNNVSSTRGITTRNRSANNDDAVGLRLGGDRSTPCVAESNEVDMTTGAATSEYSEMEELLQDHANDILQYCVCLLESDCSAKVKTETLYVLANLASHRLGNLMLLGNDDLLKKILHYLVHHDAMISLASLDCTERLLAPRNTIQTFTNLDSSTLDVRPLESRPSLETIEAIRAHGGDASLNMLHNESNDEHVRQRVAQLLVHF